MQITICHTSLYDFGDFDDVTSFHQNIIFFWNSHNSSTVRGCQKPTFLEKLNKASESYNKLKIGDIKLITMYHTSLYDFGDFDDVITFHENIIFFWNLHKFKHC